jgi:hypothetical protein
MKKAGALIAPMSLLAGWAVRPEWGRGRSTGQTLGDQGTESQRNLSAWDVSPADLRAQALSSPQDRIPWGNKLAGLPEVTPVRVTGGARPFCSQGDTFTALVTTPGEGRRWSLLVLRSSQAVGNAHRGHPLPQQRKKEGG